jgi:hypothetical protein
MVEITNKIISKYMETPLTKYTHNLSKLSKVWEKLGFQYEVVSNVDNEKVINYNFISICINEAGQYCVGFNYVVENRIMQNILDKGDTLEEAAAYATRKVIEFEESQNESTQS